jgi:excisionase family DNA binding protein
MGDDVKLRLTMTITEAAERLGIGRNQAYEAARTGQLPVIRIGKRMLVPVVAFERMLSGETKTPA